MAVRIVLAVECGIFTAVTAGWYRAVSENNRRLREKNEDKIRVMSTENDCAVMGR